MLFGDNTIWSSRARHGHHWTGDCGFLALPAAEWEECLLIPVYGASTVYEKHDAGVANGFDAGVTNGFDS